MPKKTPRKITITRPKKQEPNRIKKIKERETKRLA